MLAILVLVLWGLYAWWAIDRTRSTGQLLRQSLETDWPADGAPQLGVREDLLSTADELASGQAWAFGNALSPVASPTDDQRVVATEFFVEHSDMRTRFLAATDAARDLASGDEETEGIRWALGKAYRAAIENNQEAFSRQLDLAEKGLALISSGAAGTAGPANEQMVTDLVASIDPAYRFSQDLMLEGGAAAEKVLIVAVRNFSAGQHVEAASAVRLAGELLGVQATASPRSPLPEWFKTLAEREIPSADARKATTAVELAEAMALSATPSDAIAALLKKARRELDAQRNDTACWWAAVTLNAMGMSDAAIAAATSGNEEDAG